MSGILFAVALLVAGIVSSAKPTPARAFKRYVYAPMPQSVQNKKVNEAYERLLKSDVKYRFSIDMASLKSEGAEHARSRASERQVATAAVG